MTHWPSRFKDKVLFATGAGSGIGAAVARRFSLEGGRVAVIDLDAARATALAGELPAAIGIGCDVAQEESVRAAVDQAIDRFGRIDCLLNAAGYVKFGPIESYSYETWTHMLAVHAGGTFLTCKHILPIMRRQAGGAIVNISSVGALSVGKDNGAYAAAKGAILSFSQQLALDGAPHVRVNVIVPGRTRTGMTEPLYRDRGKGDYAEGARQSAQVSIQKRIAEPEEIAGPVCFLFSDDASFITATRLVVDGGQTAI